VRIKVTKGQAGIAPDVEIDLHLQSGNIHMYRTLVLAAVSAAAVAAPAFATTSVKVDVSGLDPKAAHEAIVRAAKLACHAEMRDSSTFEQHYLWSDCLNGAVARAEQTTEARAATKTTGAGR
jgi:hypothetical protein